MSVLSQDGELASLRPILLSVIFRDRSHCPHLIFLQNILIISVRNSLIKVYYTYTVNNCGI